MISVEEFILALDAEIKDGARAEIALRRVVVAMAERIRQRELPPVTDEGQDVVGVADRDEITEVEGDARPNMT